MSHLAGELLSGMAQIKMTHVPYKGGGPAVVDTLAGHVPLYFSSIAPSLPHIKAGRLRALALTGTVRSSQLPAVPTVAETPELKGYDATIMYAIWAPAKTPQEAIVRLHGAVVKVIQAPEFRKRLEFEGASDPIGNSPEQMAATLRTDMEKLARLVKAAGIPPQ
jgi:tripartite-type tricarboxylate transporter receptor subunit TctC